MGCFKGVTLFATEMMESEAPFFDLDSSNTREYSEIESHQASHEVVSPSYAHIQLVAL